MARVCPSGHCVAHRRALHWRAIRPKVILLFLSECITFPSSLSRGPMADPREPPRGGERKRTNSYRLSEDCLSLIEAIAKRLGVTCAAVIELSVREKAEGLGLWPPPAPSADA